MTEFWKSNPKKFCDFCRVWFADNKSSIDFHERGKKHQENVERKIGELRKKGLKQYEEQQHTKSFIQQMEEDALKAFKKDAQNDSALVSQYNQAAVEFKVRQFEEEAAKEITSTKQQQGTWYENKNKDGCSYYWNDLTEVSKWDKPAKFVAHEETSSTAADETDENAKAEQDENAKTEEDEETKEGEEESEDEVKDEKGSVKKKEKGETGQGEPSHQGQKRKGDAYGQWIQIEDEDKSTPVDLQLPESAKNYISHYQPQVEQRQPEEEFEFGIKTISSIATSSSGEKANVGFKKRKVKGGGGGRHLRQREET